MCLRVRSCCICCSVDQGAHLIGIWSLVTLVMTGIMALVSFDSRRTDNYISIIGSIVLVHLPRSVAFLFMCSKHRSDKYKMYMFYVWVTTVVISGLLLVAQIIAVQAEISQSTDWKRDDRFCKIGSTSFVKDFNTGSMYYRR